MITLFIVLIIFIIITSVILSYIYPGWNIKKATILKIGIPILIILTLLNGAFFYGKAGYSYLVQYINGTQVVHLEPGIHFKGWGEVMPFKKYLTIKASKGENEQEGKINVSGRISSIRVRFNDSVLADINVSTRFKLPSDKEKFRKMALEFRSQENLIDTTLIPSVAESVRTAAKLVSANEYISGRGGLMDVAVLDQLENGIYILDTETKRVSTNKEKIEKTGTGRVLDGETKVKTIVKIKRDKKGNPLRKNTVLKNASIQVTQAIIDNIEPEQKFKDLLAKQMAASAQASIKKQEAKTAAWDRETVIAKGETEKAKIKIAEEKKQITTLIEAETLQKEAKIQKETAALLLEKAKIEAQATKTLADAEAYKKKEIFQADGALEKKLKALVEINKNYADAIKGQSIVPTTVIGGGNGNTNSAMDLINLMTAKTAKDLNLNLNPKK